MNIITLSNDRYINFDNVTGVSFDEVYFSDTDTGDKYLLARVRYTNGRENIFRGESALIIKAFIEKNTK